MSQVAIPRTPPISLAKGPEPGQAEGSDLVRQAGAPVAQGHKGGVIPMAPTPAL